MIEAITVRDGLAMRIDHIGVLSEDIDKDKAHFELLHGTMEWTSRIVDPLQDVVMRFGRSREGLVYELLQPLSVNSPVHQSLSARKNLIHHLCYRADRIALRAGELQDHGFFPVTQPKPAVAFGNCCVQFFLAPQGWLIELVEGDGTPF